MKRKLDENDEPSPTPSAEDQAEPASDIIALPAAPSVTEVQAEPETSFSELGLDSRLLQAIALQAYREPTLIQQKAIPLALDGKHVLAKAKTGSGKTAAYMLPVLQSILKRKQVGEPNFATSNGGC